MLIGFGSPATPLRTNNKPINPGTFMKTNQVPRPVWQDARYSVGLCFLVVSAALCAAGSFNQPVFIVNTPTIAPSGGSGDSLERK